MLLFFRKKVTKKLLIPEGDFRAGGRHETTDETEANAQVPRFLSFAAIADRNQPSVKHLFSFRPHKRIIFFPVFMKLFFNKEFGVEQARKPDAVAGA